MELIGVVPSVDVIENATPRDMMNNPAVKNITLLIITLLFVNHIINIF